jgi:hypothetical protein
MDDWSLQMIYDTLKLSRSLREKAVQAEGRAEALADVNQDNLATKTDLAELKAELLKWMIGAMTAQTVAVIAAVAAIVHHG